MSGPLYTFFLGQVHFEEFKTFPWGERQHGIVGLYESYAEMLGTKIDAAEISATLLILTKTDIKGHFECPCGSSKRLRACCRSRIEELKSRLPAKLVARMYSKVTL